MIKQPLLHVVILFVFCIILNNSGHLKPTATNGKLISIEYNNTFEIFFFKSDLKCATFVTLIINSLNYLFIYLFILKNHTAERIWVEMNARVNYPVKQILNAFVNDESIDIDDEACKSLDEHAQQKLRQLWEEAPFLTASKKGASKGRRH